MPSLYYLLRARADGRYLSARLRAADPAQGAGFLLVFQADYDALIYLNAHAPEVSDQFAVETVTPSALKSLLTRWDFQGLGMVADPRLPDIEFFNRTPDS
ncbi:MAG: hypothetical protein VKI82_03285 [Leptolyngbya sp.]|nr:hypothetical protein [Leptolyngbya sp.]